MESTIWILGRFKKRAWHVLGQVPRVNVVTMLLCRRRCAGRARARVRPRVGTRVSLQLAVIMIDLLIHLGKLSII